MSRRFLCNCFALLFFISSQVLSSTLPASAISPKNYTGFKGKANNASYASISAASQAQTVLPYPSWWNGTQCDTTKVSNSAPLSAGAYYRGVPACRPIGLPTDSAHEVIFPVSHFGEYEWQCVEFSMRFMYLAYGVPAYSAPTGADVVDNYTNSTINPYSYNNPILVPVQNANPSTTNTVPQPGDILSYYTNHTAVVKATNVNSSGNGTITVVEQNASSSGTATIKVGSNAGLPPWVLDTTKIKNWLHHTVDITPQTSQPTAKVDVSGSGFGANETVNITFDNANASILLGTTTASSTGTISTTVSIPQSAQPGGHAIHVIGLSTGYSPQTVFYVQTNWPMFGYNAQATRFNTYENAINLSNVSNLVVGWSGMTGNAIESSPAVADGVVYIGSVDSYLYAFASSCGTVGVACLPLWKGSTGAQIESSPAVYNGVVYVASYNGTLYAFNASGCGQSTCSPLWTANIGNSTTSSPVVSNGNIYIGSSAGILYVFKASGCGNPTCLPIWTGTYYGSNNSSPVVANGIVYIGDVVKLYAFNASGCGQSTCSHCGQRIRELSLHGRQW
jgi:outer membrane protein assembly factor BamB